MSFFRNKKAFTIVELIIVLSVIAILIAIAIPRIKGMRDNASLVKAQKDLASITSALESYRTFNASHHFPPSTTTLQASYLVDASPNIINNILYDPFGTTPTTEYDYLCSSNGKYYVIWSVGFPGESPPTAISNAGDVSY